MPLFVHIFSMFLNFQHNSVGHQCFNHTKTNLQLGIALLYTGTSSLGCRLSGIHGCWVEKQDPLHCGLRLSVQAKESLVSCSHFVRPHCFLIPLLLSLCLALLQRAINLGQACSNISPTYSGRQIQHVYLLNLCILHKLRRF